MDPSVVVAVTSVGTAVVTTGGGVLIAVLTSKREAENAAETAADDSAEKAERDLERSLRERLVLKDEQIDALEFKVRNRDEKVARMTLELADAIAERDHLREKLDRLNGSTDHA